MLIAGMAALAFPMTITSFEHWHDISNAWLWDIPITCKIYVPGTALQFAIVTIPFCFLLLFWDRMTRTIIRHKRPLLVAGIVIGSVTLIAGTMITITHLQNDRAKSRRSIYLEP